MIQSNVVVSNRFVLVLQLVLAPAMIPLVWLHCTTWRLLTVWQSVLFFVNAMRPLYARHIERSAGQLPSMLGVQQFLGLTKIVQLASAVRDLLLKDSAVLLHILQSTTEHPTCIQSTLYTQELLWYVCIPIRTIGRSRL